MKEFFKRILSGVDAHRMERLLLILVPMLTLVIIASIITPTLVLMKNSEAEVTTAPTAEATVAPAPIEEAAYDTALQKKIYYDGAIYKYVFDLTENGTIKLSGGDDSGVSPIDANGDGLTDFGLKWLSDGASPNGGHYSSIALFNMDGTPVSGYAVSLVPADNYVPRGTWESADGITRYRYSNGAYAAGLKKIAGKLYYFNQNGEAASKLGIDVSFYNDYINWPQVKVQGIDYAIIRVGGRGWSTGSIYPDTAFRRNITEARTAGMKLGVYFYSTAVNAKEAEEEARYVLSKIRGMKLAYPVYIDVEQSGNYPRGRMDTLTKAQRAEVINAFCRVVRQGGYRPGVYSAQHYFNFMVDFSSISAYDIWLANYTSQNRMPSFSGHYEMWQFSPYGIVRGIPGVVDMNAIYE